MSGYLKLQLLAILRNERDLIFTIALPLLLYIAITASIHGSDSHKYAVAYLLDGQSARIISVLLRSALAFLGGVYFPVTSGGMHTVMEVTPSHRVYQPGSNVLHHESLSLAAYAVAFSGLATMRNSAGRWGERLALGFRRYAGREVMRHGLRGVLVRRAVR